MPVFVRLLVSSSISLTYPINRPSTYFSLIFEVTILSPTETLSSLSYSWLKRSFPSSISSRSPSITQVSSVLTVIALTLLLSSIMERTVAQVDPTSVTIPTRPFPAITLLFTRTPSLLPRLIIKVSYQFPGSLAMILAAIFG